ncbi:porin family protein [Algoriphagus resistens]|uniref:porin family protein n=1 Tax=Algoriphagus resistens TaxID=1750590 RepID=UPI0012FB8BDA|nr:porin family protein [Algoriphagus resistens]
MKKQQILYLTLFLSALLSSHFSDAQIQWGFRAGMNMSDSKFTDADGREADRDYVVRMQIGLTLDVAVWNDFFVQPSLWYQGKGFKGNGAWPVVRGNNSEFKANLTYVVLPVNLLFKPRLGKSGRLLLGAGPYVGYGLGGSWESDAELLYGDIMVAQTEGDVRFTKDGSIGDMGTYNYGKPWDYGLGFLLGYEFIERYSIQVNGDLGLANLQYNYGDYNTGEELKNMGVGISLGYKF